ncbi:MAG: tetratricopeptide repeat protein [Nevskia sp.]|nr:tetratricopeptide repeat protein [Nevskia sp.]
MRAMHGLIEELRRRNVLRAAVFYATGAWLLVQIATQVFPFFDIPNWAVRLVVVATLVGFPFALVISWFYQLTPSGFERETEAGQKPAGSIWRHRAFRLALLCAAGVALAVLIAAGLVSRRPPAASKELISIAVLPFRNLSASADNAYFAEGMQEEILTRLTQIGALRVISRRSTASYNGAPDGLARIARELGADNVLEGSVQKSADEVRINVQLVRARDGINLWSDSYDRRLSDVFGVESEVARSVTGSLKAALTGPERRGLDLNPTANPEAYDQYLRGLALAVNSNEPAKLPRAAVFLRRAVELDPRFALAWARLAQVDSAVAFSQAADQGWCEKAGREALEAARLQPDLGQVYLAQGFYLDRCKGDLAGAQAAFEQARLKLPGSPLVTEAMGILEQRRGAPEKAVDYLRQAAVLDPRNVELLGAYAQALVQLRRFGEARALSDRALNVNPDDSSMIALQVYTFQAEGRIDEAQKLIEPLPAKQEEADVFDYQVLQLLYRHQPAAAVAMLERALAQNLDAVGIGAADYYYLLGVAQRSAGDAAAARKAFADGQVWLSRFAGVERPFDITAYRDAMLCLTATGAGDAVAAGRACALVRKVAESDSPFGPSNREVLARAAALRDQPDEAIAALPQLLRESYYSYLYGAPLTPALLRQDPVWDGVRGDPRFTALAEAGG